MAKGIMMLFVAGVYIVSIGLAVRIDKGSHNPIIRRLLRKTDTLQQDVDELWAIVSTSGQQKGNETNNDIGNINKARLEQVDDAVAALNNYKSDLKRFVLTTRTGLQNEKKWLRELARNLTEKFGDLQSRVRKMFEDLGDKQNKLELQNQDLAQTIDDLGDKQYKLELQNQDLAQTIDDLKSEQQDIERNINELQKDNTRMRQVILSIQKDNVIIKDELMKMQTTTTTTTAIPTTTTTTTTQCIDSCTHDWQEFNNHCYLFVRQDKTWDEASDDCKGENGYLVEIDNNEEKEFLGVLLRDHSVLVIWIGATDQASAGEFRYINSGEKVTEEHWRAGQPDNYSGNQHCVIMFRLSNVAFLHDESCRYPRYFVCEKP